MLSVDEFDILGDAFLRILLILQFENQCARIEVWWKDIYSSFLHLPSFLDYHGILRLWFRFNQSNEI